VFFWEPAKVFQLNIVVSLPSTYRYFFEQLLQIKKLAKSIDIFSRYVKNRTSKKRSLFLDAVIKNVQVSDTTMLIKAPSPVPPKKKIFAKPTNN